MKSETLGEETREPGEARCHEVTREDVATSRELVEFIRRSPSMFHSVATIRDYLDRAGATYLPEGEAWRLERGGMYYTVRNGSSSRGAWARSSTATTSRCAPRTRTLPRTR